MRLLMDNNMSENIPSAKVYTFEEMLKEHQYVAYTCTGFSMLPLLRQRKDIVEIRPVTSRPKKYDVILYKRGDQYILHRVLKVLPDGYIIAGDHNTFIETDIKDDCILGVMTRIIRNGKSITPDNIWYRLYVHLWCDAYPVRMLLLKVKWFVCRCLSFVKRRVLRIKR